MERPIYNEVTDRHELNEISFNGHFHYWKLEYTPETYLKESEISGDEYRKGGYVKIYFNNDCVLKEFCRTPEHALVLLNKGLYDLKCFFETVGGINFLQDWKENIIGQKIHHGGIPSTVINYSGDGEILVKRDDGKNYGPDLYPTLVEEDYDDEWKDKDRIHITDKRITWLNL